MSRGVFRWFEESVGLTEADHEKLGVALGEGKERAMIFRSVVRGKIGPRNERLVHFKVAPLRKRVPVEKVVVAG